MSGDAAGRAVLLLEDDARLRGELARVFRKRGHAVKEAAGLADLGTIDVSLLDWAVVDQRLSDGLGIDAVEPLLARNPELRIVMLTGYGSIASALEAVKKGAADYLTKPADVDQLLAALSPPAESSASVASPESADDAGAPSLQRVEWEHIQRVLRDCDGNVTRAARVLGIHRRTLQRKLSYTPPVR